MVVEICNLLGVAVSPKSQAGQAVVLLGISFLFKEGKLAIDCKRKENVLAEIRDVLPSDSLSPGPAAKLKGKLQFILHRPATGELFSGLSRIVSIRLIGPLHYRRLSAVLCRCG